MHDTVSNSTVSTDNWDGEIEGDPAGASSFVIAVILIYGLSIIFLIASHVFIKNKAHRESEKQINNYFEQAAHLQDETKKAMFEQLKWSLIPVIAQSPSGRPLIAKRSKYLPYLTKYGYLPTPPPNATDDGENDSHHHDSSDYNTSYDGHNEKDIVHYITDINTLLPYRVDVADRIQHAQTRLAGQWDVTDARYTGVSGNFSHTTVSTDLADIRYPVPSMDYIANQAVISIPDPAFFNRETVL